MTQDIIGFVLSVVLLFWVFFLHGCEVESKNKIQYEDGLPAFKTRVIQWNNEVYIDTLTDVNGTWKHILPIGTEWNLCAENDRDNKGLCCYEGTLTINETGELVDYE